MKDKIDNKVAVSASAPLICYASVEPQERIISLAQSLLGQLKPQTEAYAFAVEILRALNQTKKCPKCDGKGTRDKHDPEKCRHDTHDRYIYGCYNQINCKNCYGIGRIQKDA